MPAGSRRWAATTGRATRSPGSPTATPTSSGGRRSASRTSSTRRAPGGIVASARRTARWRDEIEAAAAAHGVDPDTMEAMVLLESAGRPEVIAGDDPELASGLAQIVAVDRHGPARDAGRPRPEPRDHEADRADRGGAREGEEAGAEQEAEGADRGAAEAAEAAGPGAGAARAPRRGRRAVRSPTGAGRDGRVPRDRRQPPPADRSRHHELPHGHRQPRERAWPPTGRRRRSTSRPTRSSSSAPRRSPTRRPGSCSPRSATTARPISGACSPPSGSWSSTATTAPSSSGSARLQARKSTQEEVFHPEAETVVFAEPADIQAALDDGKLAAGAPGLRLRLHDRQADGRAGTGPRRRAGALPRAAAGGARHADLHDLPRPRDQRRQGRPQPDQHGPRPRSTRTRCSGSTTRRRPPTRCIPPAGRSTSSASTPATGRRRRSSSCSTASAPST